MDTKQPNIFCELNPLWPEIGASGKESEQLNGNGMGTCWLQFELALLSAVLGIAGRLGRGSWRAKLPDGNDS